MGWLDNMLETESRKNQLRVKQLRVPIKQRNASSVNHKTISNIVIPSLVKSNINRFYEEPSMLQSVYNTLPVKQCESEFREYPTVRGVCAMYVGFRGDRFVKALPADISGVNEVVRSMHMADIGVGPKVLDVYLCIGGKRLHLEYEKLDGTMTEYLKSHRHDVQACIAALQKVNVLLRIARAHNMKTLDFKYDNVMYKHRAAEVQWYLIDFGMSIRLANGSTEPLQDTNYNIEALRRSASSWFTGR